MDAMAIIGRALIDNLAIIGVNLMLFGMIWLFLPKWNHFKWCVEVRYALIEEAEQCGDTAKVTKLRKEIHAIEKTLPIQGCVLVGVGALILFASLFFHKQ